jgi:hypothetical protein
MMPTWTVLLFIACLWGVGLWGCLAFDLAGIFERPKDKLAAGEAARQAGAAMSPLARISFKRKAPASSRIDRRSPPKRLTPLPK